uniref:MFS domain-containing protein n=1 Tax=Globodera pallida TaxID=36090 RepID=A0A183C7E2_GLOPA
MAEGPDDRLGVEEEEGGGEAPQHFSSLNAMVTTSVHPISSAQPQQQKTDQQQKCPQEKAQKSFRWFLSYRMLTASMLCLCFASVHMMNGNIGMAMVCMVEDGTTGNGTTGEGIAPNGRGGVPKVRWSAEDQGWIFAAFNAGLLCMLFTGFLADKFNAKYMIIVSVLLASVANIAIPLTATWNVGFAIGARFLVGLAEALLQPAINSLHNFTPFLPFYTTRWFPSSERSYALGLATGGRQFGTLLIVPTAGALCAQTAFFGGWPSIFYVSALTGLFFVLIYIVVGADKPSKQNCISSAELTFITVANIGEHMGQKRIHRTVPWRRIFTSAPVWAALVSVVCHEFPLMTMIMFLPAYLHDVHHYDSTQNGIFSALPTLALWISKIASSWLNTWLQQHTAWGITYISKLLNGVGSVGLALFMLGATFLDSTRASLAVVFLCFSMFFTGLHTPGCQAALVAVAPAFSGAITGLTFFFVAIFGMINPAMTKLIVTKGSQTEWNIVFYVSTVIALIPVGVFSWWGAADVQSWARGPLATSISSCPTLGTIESVGTAVKQKSADENLKKKVEEEAKEEAEKEGKEEEEGRERKKPEKEEKRREND